MLESRHYRCTLAACCSGATFNKKGERQSSSSAIAEKASKNKSDNAERATWFNLIDNRLLSVLHIALQFESGDEGGSKSWTSEGLFALVTTNYSHHTYTIWLHSSKRFLSQSHQTNISKDCVKSVTAFVYFNMPTLVVIELCNSRGKSLLESWGSIFLPDWH